MTIPFPPRFDDELIIFYTDAGTKEFIRITENKLPEELNADDFRHHIFCTSMTKKLCLTMLQDKLKNGSKIQKAKAGILLYDYWLIEQKYEKVYN